MEKNQRDELEAVVSFGGADVPASFNLLIFGCNGCGNSGGQFAAALASKLLGRSEQRAAEVFRFPDVLVGERLQARNGGGKISWMSYGSPSGP